MENNSYEEYIRSILGYSNNNYQDYNSFNYTNNSRYSELEEYYPEIYKIVYPMVRKKCNNRTGNVTKEDIDRMVEEIYNSIEVNTNSSQIENRDINKLNEPRYFNGKKVIDEPIKKSLNQEVKQEINQNRETRQCKNCNKGLSDIIRILLLRELIGRPGFPNNRPPFPPSGGRPPFPPPNRPRYSRMWDDNFYELY